MDKVTLNEKEQKRLMVLNEVMAGRLTGAAGLARGLWRVALHPRPPGAKATRLCHRAGRGRLKRRARSEARLSRRC